MSYNDAVDFIHSSARLGSHLGLKRVGKLCVLAGSPQDRIKTVHVAGTNGKGSTSAMLASIFTSAGYRTGLYTSPYITDVRECMMIDGNMISAAEFAAVADEVRGFAAEMERAGEPPTEFEIETAMAFLWFLESNCDLAVIETGLGGRLDATNVISAPLASVITSISFDHTAILGDTVEKIAFEKCGILKPNGLAVSYPIQPAGALDVIRKRAEEEGNPLLMPEPSEIKVLQSGLEGTEILFHGMELHIPFIGMHQVWNACTAVQTAFAMREFRGLNLLDACIVEGVKKAAIPMRQQIVCRAPIVMIDGAHNPDGLAALADTMKRLLAGRRTAVVMGMLADKDINGSVSLIAPLCGKFVATSPANPRALPASALAEAAREHCPDVTAEEDYLQALAEALRFAGAEGAVVVCGSLYLAGPMRMVYDRHIEYLEQLIR